MADNNQLFQADKTVAIDRPLIAFAFLAQTATRNGDLLTGLAPIFKPIAHGNVGKRFDPRNFSEQVRKMYGIDIHPWAAEDLAPRLEKAGLLRREQLATNTHQYFYAEINAEFNEVDESDIRLVVNRFIEFSTPILKSHNSEVNEKNLEEGFFGQLIHMNFVAILRKPDRSKEDARGEQTLTIKKPPEQLVHEKEQNEQARIDVLCASFIMEVYRNDAPLYDLLVKIASGALVAEAVLNFKEPGGDVSLEKMKVMLDAPFLMSLLDLSSEENREYADALCAKLKEHKAQFAAFSHSAEELRDNLEAVMSTSSQGEGFGPTARRLSSPSFHAYAHAVKTDPVAALKERGITIIQPLNSVASYQYLADKDETDFRNSLGSYQNPLAQTRDAASVAAVVRLRSGKRRLMTEFQKTDYVFITENAHLADSAYNFLVRRKLINADEVPAVLTDRYFAGLLLVLFGGKADDVTRYRLLANCAAALEARNDVIRKMHRFLSEMDVHKANRFRALMTVERAGQHLMQLTLGDSRFLTNDNVPIILQEVEKVLIEKERQQFQEQLASVTQQHEAQVQEMRRQHEKDFNDAVASRSELAQSLLDASAETAKVRSEMRQAQDSIRDLGEQLSVERRLTKEAKRNKIVRALGRGKWAEAKTRDAIVALVGFIAFASAYLSLNITNFTYNTVLAIFAGLLVMFTFWYLPEKYFGAIASSVGRKIFSIYVQLNDMDEELEKFEIDWEKATVNHRENL